MNVDEYLKRIGCEGLKEVSLDNLKTLQKSHLKSITFENLDVQMGKHINFSLEESYNQAIKQTTRGGYCLQINSLFGWLLTQLGYELCYVPSYIYIAPRYMKFMTHIIIFVKLNGKQYFVDATSQRNEPLELVVNKPDTIKFGTFQFRKDDVDPEFYILERSPNKCFSEGNPKWSPSIKFKYRPQKLEDFKESNEIAQSVEYSTMYAKNICVKQTDNTIVALVGWRYSETLFDDNNNESRTERQLNTIEEVRQILGDKFGIVVDESFKPKDDHHPDTAFQ